VAIACQGGGIPAKFAVGVLTEILKELDEKKSFELARISGTSAGMGDLSSKTSQPLKSAGGHGRKARNEHIWTTCH
jgi:predicted patatin/cPLA2 family phospholipase